MSGCTNCGKKLGRVNKTGYCGVCWPKLGFELIRAQDPEAFRKKRSDAIKRGYEEHPERLEAARANIRRISKLPQSRAARSAKSKELRIWEMGWAAQPAGSEAKQRMGRTLSRSKLAWCPPELIPEYRRLTRLKGVPIAEAKALILEQHETDLRRLRAKMGATGPVEVREVNYFPNHGNDNPEPRTLLGAERQKAEKARVDTLRQRRTLCPICGARSDIGCEHGAAA